MLAAPPCAAAAAERPAGRAERASRGLPRTALARRGDGQRRSRSKHSQERPVHGGQKLHRNKWLSISRDKLEMTFNPVLFFILLLYFPLFTFKLNLLGCHWLIKSYRFPVQLYSTSSACALTAQSRVSSVTIYHPLALSTFPHPPFGSHLTVCVCFFVAVFA